MEYFYNRNESVLQVKINPEIYSSKKKLNELLMPESVGEQGVSFSTAGLLSLTEFISYVTEKDMLYFIYFLLKASAEWTEESDASLELILDTDAIFYNQKKHRFSFAAMPAGGQNKNTIGFAMNLLFDAVYKEKDLQTAVELISFVKASIHTTPRDVVLFLEMSKYGRSFVSDWSKLKRNLDDTKVHSEAIPDTHKNSKMFNRVNNSMDFSNFLSVDDLFSDAPSVSEEKAPPPVYENRNVQPDVFLQEDKQEVKQEVEVSQPVSVPEPFIFIEPENSEKEEPYIENTAPAYEDVAVDELTIQENVQEQEDFIDIWSHQDELFDDSEFDEQVPVSASPEVLTEEDSSDVTDIFLSVDDESGDIPFVENAFTDQHSNEEFLQDTANETSYYEENPYNEEFEVADNDYELYDADEQTVILNEEEPVVETTVASLIDLNGNVVDVTKDYFVIGRNSKESDFSLRDSSMSRRHAAIIKVGNEFYIEDLNSMNKTYVDGNQVDPGNRKLLNDGSVIFVSKNKFIFNIRIERH